MRNYKTQNRQDIHLNALLQSMNSDEFLFFSCFK